MISIIIPVYNHAHELDECLASIKEQSYDNYEIIIVNDRSTRRLGWVVRKYQKAFGIKLEIINNQTNHGAPYSRNKGFKKSKGEFVVFCDADVVMDEDFLAKLHGVLIDNKDIAFAYSSHKFGRKTFGKLEYDEERLKKMPFIHTTAMLRRSAFPKNGFDENLKRLQDWDLWLTMLENGQKGKWLDEVLFSVKAGGTMSTWLPSFSYKLFPFFPKVVKYNKAVKVIKEKHNLI
ncbi:hypothetical protein C0583_01155 [Candidatus Parcubacteria bacterium]|nr:MAG: hypothetical protein C0583_01155 [Candidatus Parcubacteria bacterium]